ncbi:MAG: adenosylcobinamide-GDP ribazoletransferase [Candidatus Omnitrophica bacterium]|nr:adenosylcobinamide-GDP ribazoletransferase [Candidatus Omnitrophota bacterium]
MKEILATFKFLTIFPFGKVDEEDLKKSIIFFPLVGMVIGYFTYLFYLFLKRFFPNEISSFFVIIFLIIITGGIHIDGFVDTIDGVFGGKNKGEILKIMEDPHIGGFSVIFLFSLLFLKFLIIKNIFNLKIPLIISCLLSRYSVCYFSYFSIPAKDYGLSKIFFQDKKLSNFLLPTIFTLVILFLFLNSFSFVIFAINILFFHILNFYFKKKIGGITGDNFGFIIETTELLNLFLLWRF